MDDVKNISIDKMKKYLKNLMELESEKYKLKEIKDKLDYFNIVDLRTISSKNFENYNRERRTINDVKENEIRKIKSDIENIKQSKLKGLSPPDKPRLKPVNLNTGIYVFLSIVGFYLFNSCIQIIFSKYSNETDILLSIVLGIFSAFVFIVGITKYNEKEKIKTQNENENKILTLEYEKRLKKYEEDIIIYQNNLNSRYQDMFILKKNDIVEKYNIEIEECSKKIEIKNQIVDDVINKNNELIKKTEENLILVNSKLEELYSYNIIYEKYRNLVAVSMFYEYFDSSRVFELGGRDGAYNLFESEMRQNFIIVTLSGIYKRLDEIKQNQYCMYKELVEVNSTLNSIDNNIDYLENYVSNINDNVSIVKEIDKYLLVCSNEINKNINKIKDIAMANFLFK